MLATGGRLTLVHVEPDVDFRAMGKEGWGNIYSEGVSGLFRRLVANLRAPDDIEVETAIVRGDPSAALLELAGNGGVDLIAAGSRSTPWPELDPAGSVSAALLRGAACAVLVAPPPERRS
jgi:nucleotide-binding universal stress UspA family protein